MKLFRLFKKKSVAIDDKFKPFVINGHVPDIGRIEQSSPTWVFIDQWAKAEIETLRKKNDNINASKQQTTIYRAEIRLLKKIVALPGMVTIQR